MNFPPHDKFCEYHGETMYGTRPCTCDYIARIRADEREQAVQRVRDFQAAVIGELSFYPMGDYMDGLIEKAIRGEQS